jgi:hypothetical protein
LCTLSSVTFNISLLTIPNNSVLISISFCTFSSVTFNTEVLGIINGEIVKVTDESVQKEIYINIEVLGYIFLSVHCHLLLLLFHH